MKFQDQVKAGVEAVRAKQAGQPHDEAAAKAMTDTAAGTNPRPLSLPEVTALITTAITHAR